MSPVRGYEANPCHAITGLVGAGYRSAVSVLAPGVILAVDGPSAAGTARHIWQLPPVAPGHAEVDQPRPTSVTTPWT
jgi:hypothetical protein